MTWCMCQATANLLPANTRRPLWSAGDRFRRIVRGGIGSACGGTAENWDQPVDAKTWVPQESGGDVEATAQGIINIPVAAVSMSGHTFNAPAQWQDFTLEFDVERGKPVTVGAMYLGRNNCAARKDSDREGLNEIGEGGYSRLRKFSPPNKVHYKHGEPGLLKVYAWSMPPRHRRRCNSVPSLWTRTERRHPTRQSSSRYNRWKRSVGTCPFRAGPRRRL